MITQTCPNCSQKHTIVNEGVVNDSGTMVQKFWCVNCGHKWEVKLEQQKASWV